jgi:pimeloyl-ACP methyl ester carboxylesterase
MSVGTSQYAAIDGYEAIEASSGRPAATRPATAIFRRRSAMPSRRAVLHLHANGSTPAPADLASWYTERAFHFYVAGLRLPGKTGSLARRQGRMLSATFAELDATCSYLRDVDGMTTVIVAADGIGAQAAALWCDARRSADPADALILQDPDFGEKPRLSLDITCPVLVLSGAADRAAEARRGQRSARKRPAGTVRLGGHVTWLSIPAADQALAEETTAKEARVKEAPVKDATAKEPTADDSAALLAEEAAAEEAAAAAERSRFFDEMGRWLGAYMYGPVRDQLL